MKLTTLSFSVHLNSPVVAYRKNKLSDAKLQRDDNNNQ